MERESPLPPPRTPPTLPGWLLERLLPSDRLEFALGDLDEEYRLRVAGASRRAADRWYWIQVLRSLPTLFRQAFRQAGPVQTLAVTGVVYVGANTTESHALDQVQRLALDDGVLLVTSLLVGLLAFATGGYVAFRIRRPAAILLGLIVLGIMLRLVARGGLGAPLWYQFAFLLAGPLAPIAGAVIASRHRSTGDSKRH